MSKLTAAYIAGFIDGEGHITLRVYHRENQRTLYAPQLRLASTDKWIIEWFKDSFGGGIHHRVYDNPNYNDAYDWSLNGTKLKPFLLKIQPYLKLKKKQCKLVLRKIKIQENFRKNIPHQKISEITKQRKVKQKVNSGYRDEVRKEIENLYWELRKLNHRGK